MTREAQPQPDQNSMTEWRVLWAHGTTTVGIQDRDEAVVLAARADGARIQSRAVGPWTDSLAPDEEEAR